MTRKTEKELVEIMRRRALETGSNPSVSITERLQAALVVLICDDLIDSDDDN